MPSDAARSPGRSCRRPHLTPHRPAPSAHRSPASARCGVGCGATRGLRSPASRGARPGRSWRLSGPEPSMTCGHKPGGRARHRAPACRAGRRRACGLTGSRGASLTTGRGPDAPLASTHAQEPIAAENRHNPLAGDVGLLTTGGLIRVRLDQGRVRRHLVLSAHYSGRGATTRMTIPSDSAPGPAARLPHRQALPSKPEPVRGAA